MLRLSSFTPRATRPLTCLRTSPLLCSPVTLVSIIPRGSRGHTTKPSTTESNSLKSKRKWPSVVGIITAGAAVLGAVFVGLEYLPDFDLPLDEKEFRPFVIESKERVSSTSSIFNLVPSSAFSPKELYERQFRQGVWSVQVKQPQLQIARAYTPLPPLHSENGTSNPDVLRFLIRHDPKGEVSSYLHNLSPGSKIELRGPQIEHKLPKKVDATTGGVDEVIFIAGGTGIAPALQVAHTLYDLRLRIRQPPKIRILWANRKREECIGAPLPSDAPTKPSSGLSSLFTFDSSPRSEKFPAKPDQSPLVRHLHHLEALHPNRFSVEYFVDEEQSFINEQAVKDSLQITQRTGDEEASRRKLILVSGPEGFVNYMAGPKRWVGGREIQGELGGLLSRIDHSGWEVWKL